MMFPKPKPKALEKRERDTALTSRDKAENAKAKKRAGGQCEVLVVVPPFRYSIVTRCLRRDTQTHHLLGGIGRRNKGKSILADYKLRVCDQCHRDITGDIGGKRLIPATRHRTAVTVRYRRYGQ